MPRVTRQSTAQQTALTTAANVDDAAQDSSSLQSLATVSKNASKSLATKKNARTNKAIATPKSPVANIGKKRKRTTKLKVEEKFDVNELPHGLGKIVNNTEVDENHVQDTIEPQPAKTEDGNLVVTAEDLKAAENLAESLTDNATVNTEEASVEETTAGVTKDNVDATAKGTSAKKTKAKRSKPDPNKPKRVKKVNKYGVTLGETPYPDWPAPTAEQAEQVNKLLSEAHGEIRAPKEIPLPSLTVAGCGEVPNILEALMRTLLSAHTTNKNAGTAVQGMIKRYGTVKDGPAKGTVDWNAVRMSSREEVEQAIKHGGLAKSKSSQIWKTVEMVYDENQKLREELAKNGTIGTDEAKTDTDGESMDMKSKSAAYFLEDPNVLTLDYMHVMRDEEAFQKFITLPGIGVKTASCTLLFCMQRKSFAVDTHVYRLCQYLGWVPMDADRDKTFAHCDVRIPNELKYSLHQLLIAHGKTCGRCRAITGESSEGWDKGCVLEALVKRYGAKKGGEDKSPKKAGAKAEAKGGLKKKVKTESGEEDENMESLGDDEEDYSPVKKAKKLAKATKPKASKAKRNKKDEATDEDAVKNESGSGNGAGKKKAKTPTKPPKKKAVSRSSRKRKATEAEASDEDHGVEEAEEAAATAVNATGASEGTGQAMANVDAAEVAEAAGKSDGPVDPTSDEAMPDATGTADEADGVDEAMPDAAEETELSEAVGRSARKAAAPKKPAAGAARKAKAPPRKRAKRA